MFFFGRKLSGLHREPLPCHVSPVVTHWNVLPVTSTIYIELVQKANLYKMLIHGKFPQPSVKPAILEQKERIQSDFLILD